MAAHHSSLFPLLLLTGNIGSFSDVYANANATTLSLQTGYEMYEYSVSYKHLSKLLMRKNDDDKLKIYAF